MDKQKSKLNITVSVLFRIVTALLVILVRRQLIQTCGNEANGLNSLYISIVGFLSVAELGVGSAITYSMYRPVVDGDKNRVSALYYLYRKLYRIIGTVILAGGLLLTPFLHFFAKDYAQLDVNLHLTFLLMLLSCVITYFYSAKSALIIAHKNNYITAAIDSGGLVLQYMLQIICLRVTGSFVGYLICRIVTALAQWAVTERITRRKYGDILRNKQFLEPDDRKDVTKNIIAMFQHKIGAVLVNSSSSIVIALFAGVIVLGEYSNYTTIQTTMAGILGLVFTSLSSVFGHLYVKNEKAVSRRYCESFYLLNFVIGTVFHLGYYAIVDNLVALLFSAELVVTKTISFVITLNGFIQFMRRNTLTFRDATGVFYNDRWKPLVEGVCNIVLSVILAQWIGVIGVIVATIITNLLLCHIVEPYVLYKHAFHAPVRTFYLKSYSLIALFAAALGILNTVMIASESHWRELLVNGFISVGISLCVCMVAVLLFWDQCKLLCRGLGKKRRSIPVPDPDEKI